MELAGQSWTPSPRRTGGGCKGERMNITSRRVLDMPPYMFAEIDRVKRRLREEGRTLLDFGIGDPDLPTPSFIVDALCEAARDPKNHRYPQYAGMREFR